MAERALEILHLHKKKRDDSPGRKVESPRHQSKNLLRKPSAIKHLLPKLPLTPTCFRNSQVWDLDSDDVCGEDGVSVAPREGGLETRKSLAKATSPEVGRKSPLSASFERESGGSQRVSLSGDANISSRFDNDKPSPSSSRRTSIDEAFQEATASLEHLAAGMAIADCGAAERDSSVDEERDVGGRRGARGAADELHLDHMWEEAHLKDEENKGQQDKKHWIGDWGRTLSMNEHKQPPKANALQRFASGDFRFPIGKQSKAAW